jgi:hypothetical protein
MSGLSAPTIALLAVFATVLAATVLVQLHLLVKVLTGLDVVALAWAVPGLARRALGFLERAFRDIVEGFKDAVEWTVYGVRHAGL